MRRSHLSEFPLCLVFCCIITLAQASLLAGTEAEGSTSYAGINENGKMQEGLVRYGGLADKGISGESVRAAMLPYAPPRAVPMVTFPAEGPHQEKVGSVALRKVKVQIAGEGSEVQFGFPLARGALFDLRRLRISVGEKPVASQANVLALWPDGSLKSLLVQFTLPPKGGRLIEVAFGSEVSPGPESSPIHYEEKEDSFSISTGVIDAVVGKNGFVPLREVYATDGASRRLLATGSGLELRDESGQLYTSAGASPETIRIERRGTHDFVLRAEGKYAHGTARWMRYVTRLRFIAGSGRVEVATTHYNDELATEFSDFSSLGMQFQFPNMEGWESAVDLGSHGIRTGPFALVQRDEDQAVLGEGKILQGARAVGVAEVRTLGRPVRLGITDFWQRWPKAIESRAGQLQIGLLPPLSGEHLLPMQLAFPFVEGRYRMKWGMSFTERFTLDFGGSGSLESFSGATVKPAFAVLPADYTAGTGVFGPLPSKGAPGVERWNGYMQRSLASYRQHREADRAYGFLNWGDWFGERGHNWGNNEYDRAHGLAMQFLQTGEGEYLAEALSAARHQADVDIVHAYPDPYYLGANPQHSIGHTGISYQPITPKTWSYAYDGATSARNGHTWSNGMVDCWLLTGDPVVMEAALALGEHIRWALLSRFHEIGDHERSAGWSLLAAMGIYRATSDPAYLEGATRIKQLALKEWDPVSGIWPHILPAAHAKNRTGVRGNSVYNIGILMMGLAQYHHETGDPEVLECLDRACAWLMKSWTRESGSWPYSADVDGEALAPTGPLLNPLIYPALAYTGLVKKKSGYLQLAREALLSAVPSDATEKLPKSFSIKMVATMETLALLDRAVGERVLSPLQEEGSAAQALPDPQR